MARDRRRAPRVLYLAFFAPPARGSGVHRIRATANHLASRGWDVTVFAAPDYYLRDLIHSCDDALTGTVDPRVRVLRPGMNYYVWESDVRRFGRLRATFPWLARRAHRMALARVFPEKYWSWGANSLGWALRLHARRRFDIVVATGNPFVSFATAWLLHRLTGVAYVLDYRDSWTLDQFRDAPAFPPEHPAWRWERRVLSRAAAVTFVNDAQRQWHARRHPEAASRMRVVLNGWDPDLLSAQALPASAGPVRFAFLGTVTGGQPIEQLFEAFRLARRSPVMAGAQVHIYGYLGFFPGERAPLLARLEAAGGDMLTYHGPVSKTEVASVYRDNDVLLFMTAGGRYVTTGKVFEYMASGRPIVSVHAPDNAATEVLEGYPLWFNPWGLHPEPLAKALVAAATASRSMTAEQAAAARAHAARYTRGEVLAPFERMLRDLALDPSGGQRS